MKTRRSKFRAFGVCLLYLVALTAILSIRSKTADLVLVLLLFGGQLTLGISALAHLRIHYDHNGQMRFRYDRRGILAWWLRWIADEPHEER